MTPRSSSMLAAFFLCATVAQACGQQVDALRRPTTDSISDLQRQSLMDLANDLPQLGKYRDANAAVSADRSKRPRVVFYGDSLTEGWGMTKRNGSVFFPDKPNYLNRGISGQTTLQMLVRMRQDVIDLHPDVVLILGGTNDIAGNTGPSSIAMIMNNIESMVDLARAHGIRPVICSVLPAAKYRWRPEVDVVPAVRLLNAELRKYAAAQHVPYADYYDVLATADGAMRDGMSWDGVHPQAAGYERMRPVAEAAIQAAMHARQKRQ